MSEFIPPDPQYKSVELEAAPTKGDSDSGEPFRDLFFMGQVQTVPLTASLSWMDDDLKVFIRDQFREAKFHLVMIACDFRPRNDARIIKATVYVSLNGQPKMPVAWSMNPMKLTRELKINHSAKLSADAKLFSVELGGSQEESQETAYLEAHNLQSSDPYWKFDDADGKRLQGVFSLKLVVRVPTGIEGNGLITVETIVRHRTLFFPRTANLGAAAMDSFVLK